MNPLLWKAIGVLCILGAGGYISLALSRYERLRLGVLDAYIALIYHIKGQIDCYALPIRDILMRADPALLAACLGVDILTENRLLTLLAAPESPLLRLVRDSRLYLDPEAERLLSEFARELGHTNRADQVARCDHYIATLGDVRRRLSEALPDRIRLVVTLTLCATVGAAILLW